MNIARTAYAAAIVAAGALATGGVASAAPALNLSVETTPNAVEATPVHHYGYGYNRPYYGYPRYYAPYGYPYGYYHRPRSHGRLFIGAPGFRLGVGW